MKPRWSILIGLAVVGLICALLVLGSDHRAQQAVQETRSALRQQGFKTDLADFSFSTSVELRAREAALTNADLPGAARRVTNYPQVDALQVGRPDLMAVVGADSAAVVWREAKLTSRFLDSDDLWPVFRTVFAENRTTLDAACRAALAGPIQFDLVARDGYDMRLPHLTALKRLAHLLGTRAALELRDGHRDAAWTNLLAATRLTLGYDPEPAEVSHLTRFDCAVMTGHTTWQVLQAGGWGEERLAHLQREWESVGFFKGLPETAAFARASMVAMCQLERQQPLGPLGGGASFSLRSAWSDLRDRLRQIRYRHHGTYEDESALLLHFRDRELELRRAVQCPTWSEMRALPGITNPVPFQSKHLSAMQAMMNLGEIRLRQAGLGRGLLGRAAEAEARRRLIITAIALERYHGRHGSYPRTLGELVPEFLRNPPNDFMNGEPLRYHLAADGHFVLHSVGLDCADDGGRMRRPGPRGLPYAPTGVAYEGSSEFGIPFGTDLVWPRPASPAEVAAQKEADERPLKEALEQAGLPGR